MALWCSHVRARIGKTKQRCQRRPNRILTSIYLELRPIVSIKHLLMDNRGFHQAFSNGPHKEREEQEELNKHKVKGSSTHILV